jgi:hypothetical protein
LLEYFRICEANDGDVVRFKDGDAPRVSSFAFWSVMVCAIKWGGELELDTVKVKAESCEYVLAAYFGLAESQVLIPKVLSGSSGVFSEFSSA